MKKFITSMTILASMVASTVLADTPAPTSIAPNVTAGGMLTVEGGFRHQKSGYKTNINTPGATGQNLPQGNKNWLVRSQARAYVKAMGRADAGFNYGGVIGISTNNNGYATKGSSDLDNTYLFVETGAGRIELGSNYSAASNIMIDATKIARGTGGIGGDWINFANMVYYTVPNTQNTVSLNAGTIDATGYAVPLYLTSTDFMSDSQTANKEQALKITYYTPEVAGFQVGVSYTPDGYRTGDKQGDSVPFNIMNRYTKNIFSGGIKYANNFDQIGFSASLLGEMGKSPYNPLTYDNVNSKHNLKGWAAGAALDMAGFSVAGSYGATDKKFVTIDAFSNRVTGKMHAIGGRANYWTAGAAYVQGPMGVSGTYMSSKLQGNKFKNLVFSADYQLAPGMLPFVEASLFKFQPRNTIKVDKAGNVLPKNKGQVYLVGAQLAF